MHPRTGPEFLLRELLAPLVDRTYEQLHAATRGADLLVTHPVTFAGPVLAEATGMPWVSTVLAPTSLMSEHDPFVMPPAPWLKQVERFSRWPTVMLMRLAHRMSRPWLAPVDALRARLGLPRARHPVFEGQHSPTLVLALFSRVLAEPQVDWPPNVRITGHVFYDAGHGASLAPELARFLDDGEPPLVFTLGSTMVFAAGRFYEESVAAGHARRSKRCSALGPNELLVRHPVRLIGVRTFPLLEVLDVRLVVPLVPDHLAVPLEREDVRRDAIEEPAIVRRSRRRIPQSRAALPRAHAAYRRRDRSSARRAAAGCRRLMSVLARCRRLRSPPDRFADLLLLIRRP